MVCERWDIDALAFLLNDSVICSLFARAVVMNQILHASLWALADPLQSSNVLQARVFNVV